MVLAGSGSSPVSRALSLATIFSPEVNDILILSMNDCKENLLSLSLYHPIRFTLVEKEIELLGVDINVCEATKKRKRYG